MQLAEFDVEPMRRIAVIMAHPDDTEYGAAAAVARWVDLGIDVRYLMITSGEQGIEGMAPEVAGPIREGEERASALLVGASVQFLGFPDGAVQQTERLERRLVGWLRDTRPDSVITLNHHPRWAGGAANHPDHVHGGRAVINACRQANDATACVELGSATSIRMVAVNDSPRCDLGVDVTGYEEVAEEALLKHDAYLRGLGGPEWSIKHLRENLSRAGRRLGARSGVAFEQVELAQPIY